MSVTLLRKINKAAADPNHFDNNYLGEVLEAAADLIEQLKKENERLKDAINTIGESALGGSGDHSSAPYDCEDIYKICCELTKNKE